MSFHPGFRAPIFFRPRFRFRAPNVRPERLAVPGRTHIARFAHFRHLRAPLAWVGAPWWVSALWYDLAPDYVAPDYIATDYVEPNVAADNVAAGDVPPGYVPLVAPGYIAPDETTGSGGADMMPPHCGTQTYEVPAEDGGTRTVKVVRRC
jgi:hypothetical protein